MKKNNMKTPEEKEMIVKRYLNGESATKIADEYKNKYSIKSLCEYMSVSRSSYYKWKYRQEHPTLKMISRQSDIELITKIHK